ncbi:GGDEF domain-containing protein [Sulfurospirillum arcachonense]|uniref:GGDEF domain-containing protein n=1 Tax=Sulfurospirillum arcachonense TaxID=57666 RepID=UPI00247FF705|nr:GGDEF domain-containing protein [Sulfurospirillum arcachonense]
MCQQYLRHKHVFSIMMLDIDHFKDVNDTYGHQIGDSVLIEFANILKKHSRKTDIVGRWGGEEFIIICLDTNIQGATNLAENLRASIEEFEFSIINHKTVSIGVSEVKDTDNIKTLIKRVDDYLYKAKESGRNKVISDI